MKRLSLLLSTALLLLSCMQEQSDALPDGTPVMVCLPFNLAESDHPEVTIGSASASASKIPESNVAANASPLQVAYTAPVSQPKLRSSATLSNVWVLQFDSTTLACKAASYVGAIASDSTVLPPTLLVTGTNQVVYVIANGPASGSITTSTYTLATFKSSAYFSGLITSDASMPYVGRAPGGVTITSDGIVGVQSITIKRIVAKVSLTLHYNMAGCTLESVKMYNKPKKMYYNYGSDATTFPATPTVADYESTAQAADVVPGTPSKGTYVWYTGENKRGVNAAITSVYDKDCSHAPEGSAYCTFIRITAKGSDGFTRYVYDLYVGENGTTDFNLKRNWDYTISTILSGTQIDHKCYESIDKRINSTIPSNCHIAAPNQIKTVPVNIKGNGSSYTAGLAGRATTHTASSVRILWQTTSKSLISLSNFNATTQTVDVTAGKLEGNAVIAAYAADGTTILWSWHIWVTDQPASEAINGNVWMDRNLGATEVATNTSTVTFGTCGGLLYQWGRKDPFPGSDGLTVGGATAQTLYNTTGVMTNASVTWPSSPTTTATGTTGDVVKYADAGASPISYSYQCIYSIMYPLLFFKNWAGSTATAGDAYTTAGGKDSWGGDAGQSKSIFDPCPSGWRVPTGRKSSSTFVSPWSTWDTKQSTTGVAYSALRWDAGGVFGGSYYPAVGCRTVYTPYGGILSVGTDGNYWTASAKSSGVPAHYLLFYNGSIDATHDNYRPFGFSVRCVKE